MCFPGTKAVCVATAIFIMMALSETFVASAQPKPSDATTLPLKLDERRLGGGKTNSMSESLKLNEQLTVASKTTISLAWDGTKDIASTVPSKVSIESSNTQVEGVLYFSRHPTITLEGASFRPSGAVEAKELKFKVSKQVSFETSGSY